MLELGTRTLERLPEFVSACLVGGCGTSGTKMRQGGDLVQQDLSKCEQLWERAAEQGDDMARENLATLREHMKLAAKRITIGNGAANNMFTNQLLSWYSGRLLGLCQIMGSVVMF